MSASQEVRLSQAEAIVNGTGSRLDLIFIDYDRSLDLRSRDHLNVDVGLGERGEHLSSNA